MRSACPNVRRYGANCRGSYVAGPPQARGLSRSDASDIPAADANSPAAFRVQRWCRRTEIAPRDMRPHIRSGMQWQRLWRASSRTTIFALRPVPRDTDLYTQNLSRVGFQYLRPDLFPDVEFSK